MLLKDKFGHKKIIDNKTFKSTQIIHKFKIKIVYNQLRTLRMIVNKVWVSPTKQICKNWSDLNKLTYPQTSKTKDSWNIKKSKTLNIKINQKMKTSK